MLLSMKMYTQESSSEVSYKNRCFSTGGLQGHVFCGLLVSMLEITFLSPISYSTDWVTKCSSTVKADLFGEGFILHLGSTINMCSVAAMLSYMVCMISVSFSVADVREYHGRKLQHTLEAIGEDKGSYNSHVFTHRGSNSSCTHGDQVNWNNPSPSATP